MDNFITIVLLQASILNPSAAAEGTIEDNLINTEVYASPEAYMSTTGEKPVEVHVEPETIAPIVALSEMEMEVDVPEITVNIPEPEPEPAVTPERNNAPASNNSRDSVSESNASKENKTEAKQKKETEPKQEAQAPSGGKGTDVVAYAKQFIGTPYVSGGKTPSGFDCSGFTSYVYKQFGINIPSSSSAQRNVGTVVSSPQPGDLIWTPGHVGIYVGDGQQIDAPRPGKTIQVRGIWQSNPTYIRLIN